jgi:hypothetical protein
MGCNIDLISLRCEGNQIAKFRDNVRASSGKVEMCVTCKRWDAVTCGRIVVFQKNRILHYTAANPTTLLSPFLCEICFSMI